MRHIDTRHVGLLQVALFLCLFFAVTPVMAQSDGVHRCGPTTDLIVGRWQAAMNPSRNLYFGPDGEASASGYGEAAVLSRSSLTYTLDTLRAAPITTAPPAASADVAESEVQVLTFTAENGQAVRYRVSQLNFDALVLRRESATAAGARTEKTAHIPNSEEEAFQYERLPDGWAGAVEIVGPSGFVAKTQSALQLLREVLPAHDRFFRHYVRRVQRHCPSGSTIWRRTGLVHISDRLAELSPAVYVSVLVHEAVHVYQYVRAGQNASAGTPVSLCSPASEREALAQQAAVLRTLDRDHPLLSALDTEDGRYIDQDGDGDCDAHDYARRRY